MPVEWSGLSPDLMLSVDRALAAPLRSQLEDQLREAIRHGRVRAGERLPSSRALARDLGLSRGLVQDCYAQLLAEGYLAARTGSATVVAPGAEPPRPSPARAGRPRRWSPTSRTGCRISAASRAPTGRTRCGRRAGPRRPPRSAMTIRAAIRGCARSWPLTCAGSGARRPTRSASWCAPASRRDSRSRSPCSGTPACARSASRIPVTPTPGRSRPGRPGWSRCPSRSTPTASTPMR